MKDAVSNIQSDDGINDGKNDGINFTQTEKLIMKNKELLLDRDPKRSPVRFIFSHSAFFVDGEVSGVSLLSMNGLQILHVVILRCQSANFQ